MLHIDILKEPAEEYKKYINIQEQFELDGNFNEDVNENSYEGTLPVDENFEFIKKGFKNALKHAIYSTAMRYYTNKIAKFVKLKVVGNENLKGIKEAIVTCNHISKFDSFAVRKAIGINILFVAADFNNWTGKMGDLARYNGYLPLSSKYSVMKKFNQAIEFYLNKGKKILIYPEQAMWRDYKKPRPMKDGAFHYAVKHNVPILPLFITFRPSGIIEDGVEFMYYTIHILKPIYQQVDKSNKDNVEYLRKENFASWKECYENTYNTPLEYTTLDKSKIKI